MRSSVLSLLCLLWSLVEVHSQSAPYVSFMGETLANHAYVDLTLVGDGSGNSVRCNTDLTTCCTSDHWYFPNETALQLIDNGDSIYQRLGNGRVVLRRMNNAMGPTGIYRCEVPTISSNPMSETVYVGLYASGGE